MIFLLEAAVVAHNTEPPQGGEGGRKRQLKQRIKTASQTQLAISET